MSGHDTFREMLARRAELSGTEEARLRAHLIHCPECRERAEAYARQTALLRAMPPAEPPAALRAGVLDVIRRAPAVTVPFWRRHAALAALAAALLVVGVRLATLQISPNGDHSTASRAFTSLRSTPRVVVEGVPPKFGAQTASVPSHPSRASRLRVRHASRPRPTASGFTGGTVAGNVPAPVNQPIPGGTLPTPTPLPPEIHVAAGAPPPGSQKSASGHDAATGVKGAPGSRSAAGGTSNAAPVAPPPHYAPRVPAAPPAQPAPSVQPAPPTGLPAPSAVPFPTPEPFATAPAVRLAAPVRPTVTASPTATPPPTPAPVAASFSGPAATPTLTPTPVP